MRPFKQTQPLKTLHSNMKYDNEEQIDNYIRSRLARPNVVQHNIRPSADFTRKVMSQVGLIERRRRWMGYFLAVVLSMAPLALREIWFFVRHDYFSISSLPMGRFIVEAYRFFLSPAALYILLALSILAFLFRASRLHRSYNYNSIKIA